MMNNHFIKNIEIRDFKCFENFKAKGFTQVNLIGGKNNLGKTAFMEAVFVNASASSVKLFISALFSVKALREFTNSFLYKNSAPNIDVFMKHLRLYIEQSNNIFVKSNINTIYFKVEETEALKEYSFKIDDNEPVVIKSNDISIDLGNIKNCDIIIGTDFSNETVKKKYSFIQEKDKEAYFDQLLNNFDQNIQAFKIINEIPQCKVSGKYLPITELGDGTGHLITLVTSLFSRENGYVFIDELDNGIHFTMLDTVWDIVFTLSKELNIQIFATTHSRECIEAFNRQQIKQQNKESAYFELAREKETEITFMSLLSSDQLEYELSHKGKFRGE